MIDRHSLSRRGSSTIADTAKWVNTSGETVPAYGVVQFRTNFAAGYNQAKKPNGAPGLYFANGPVDIPDTKSGESLMWNRARLVLLDGEPEVGAVVGPIAGSWSMSEEGTGFLVMHQPSEGVGSVVQVGSNNAVELCHGVVIEQCNASCSTYRVQKVHRYLKPVCDQEASGSGSGSGV